MKKRLLEYIVCPECGAGFDLKCESSVGEEILAGLLDCKLGHHKYAIYCGVPHLNNISVNHQLESQTQNSFNYKWASAPKYGYDKKTEVFRLNWYLERYGWACKESLAEYINTRKMILDAGTGLGSQAKMYAEMTDGDVFAIDISDSVLEAYTKIGCMNNVHIIKADIMNMPFKPATFDFIASDQVLHHTPDTKKAFNCLREYMNGKAQIAIYVYKKKGRIREYCDSNFRKRTTRMTEAQCWQFAKAITDFGHELSDIDIDLQRWVYWDLFKCFWNDEFDYNTNVIHNFDWYHPKYAWRHKPGEVREWCADNGLNILHEDISQSGISVRATPK